MSWETIKFSNLYYVESRNGLTKPSRVRGSGYKMINMGELFSYDRIYDIPMELVPLSEREKVSSKVEKGDLLFARQSLVLEGAGKCSVVMEVSPLTVFESHLIRVRLDKEKANSLFYYYYFKSPQSPIKSIVSQCAQSGIRGSDLGELSVALPPIDTQNKIANILSSYDDLIENNQKQIKLLEEAAQRLYKEWFVDLRFPGHENTPIIDGVPSGWKKGSAESFFEITIGKTPPRAEEQWFTDIENGTPWVSISDMGETSTFIYETSEGLTPEAINRHNVKIIPADTVLLSFKLTVGRVAITTTEMCTNEAIAHFRMADPIYREYVYCFLKDYHYDALGSTSSISKAVNSKIIKAMPFVMPNDELISEFSKILSPIFDLIKNKQKVCLELKQARDRLLPKLMSGEIDVENKKQAKIVRPIKLSYDEFLSELGMAARAKKISDADLKAMYEAYLDDETE